MEPFIYMVPKMGIQMLSSFIYWIIEALITKKKNNNLRKGRGSISSAQDLKLFQTYVEIWLVVLVSFGIELILFTVAGMMPHFHFRRRTKVDKTPVC